MSFDLGITKLKGNLKNNKLNKNIDLFFAKYFDMFRRLAQESDLGLVNFTLGKQCNYYFAIDKELAHFIYSSDFAVGTTEITHLDLSEEKVDQFETDEIIKFLKSKLGFTQCVAFSISIDILHKSVDDIANHAEELAIRRIKPEIQAILKKINLYSSQLTKSKFF
jgi:hypothetical protein